MFRKHPFVIAMALGVLAGGTVTAQEIRVREGAYVAAPGGTVTLPVELETTEDVTGFSFGVTHDESVLTLDAVNLADDLTAVADTESDFFLVDDELEGTAGFIVAVILDPDDAEAVLSAGTHHLVDAVYTASAEAAEATDVSVAAGLGAPGVDLIVDIGGGTAVPFEGSSVSISFPEGFRRGDVNGNGNFELTDAVFILRYLFQGGDLGTCPVALNVDGSVNGDGAEDLDSIQLNDAVQLLRFIFLSGISPADPWETCGQATSPLTAEMMCTVSPGCG